MAVDQLKIVALNIRSGGGTRVARLCAYLDSQQADILVLTDGAKNGQAGISPRGPKQGACTATGSLTEGTGMAMASSSPRKLPSRRSVTPPRPENHPTGSGTVMVHAAWQPGRHNCWKWEPKTGVKPPKPPFFAVISDMAVTHIKVFDRDRRPEQRPPGETAKRREVHRTGGLRRPERQVGLVDLWRLTR